MIGRNWGKFYWAMIEYVYGVSVWGDGINDDGCATLNILNILNCAKKRKAG